MAGGACLGVHFQPLMHRLVVPHHLPAVPHVDRLLTDRADVKLSLSSFGGAPWSLPVIGGPRSDSFVMTHPTFNLAKMFRN